MLYDATYWYIIEAVISLDAVMLGVVEGEIARVCIDINDENLLDTENPPTVEIATEESESNNKYIHSI